MDTKKTAELLKSLRKAKGYTQAYVAEELMVSVKTISRWESGEGLPDINIITSVAEFYELTVDELLRGERNSNKVISNQTVELKNKEKNKLIKNNMMNRFNKYFYASLIICLVGLILGIIIGVFASILIGIMIFIMFDILSLIPITSNYLEIKKEMKEEDNEDLSNGIKFALESIKKKLLLYLDIFISVIFLSMFLSLYLSVSFSLLPTTGTLFCLTIILYLLFRHNFKKETFNKYKYIHMVSIFISIVLILFFASARIKVSGGFIMEYHSILFYLSVRDAHFRFRIIAIIIMLLCISLLFISYKKNKPILSLIFMVTGTLASMMISLDFYLCPKKGVTIVFEVMPNPLAVIILIVAIILFIISIKNKRMLILKD